MIPSFSPADRLGYVALAALCWFASLAAGHEKTTEQRGTIVAVSAAGHLQLKTKAGGFTLPLQGVAFPVKDQPFAAEAIAELKKRLPQGEVTCVVIQVGDERFLRVRSGDGWLNKEVIEAGLAWHDPRQFPLQSLAEAQAAAKAARRGLWVDEKAMPPWEYHAWRTANAEQLQAEQAALFNFVRTKQREQLHTMIPAEERAQAVAVIEKAVAAMGGKEQLQRLTRAHFVWQIDLSPESCKNLNQSIRTVAPFGVNPDKQTFVIDLWWDGPERCRIKLQGDPPLRSPFQQDAQLSLNVHWFEQKLLITIGSQIAGKDELFLEFPLPGKPTEEAYKLTAEDLRQIRQMVNAVQEPFAVFPLTGENYLIKAAPVRPGDVGPAIQVLPVAMLDFLTTGVPLPVDAESLAKHPYWVRHEFDGKTGLLHSMKPLEGKEVTTLSAYQPFDGLRFWTKLDISFVPNDKIQITKLELPAQMDAAVFQFPVLSDPVKLFAK